MNNVFAMNISEYLELLASHDVPGSSVLVDNIYGDTGCEYIVTFYCSCEDYKEHHRLLSQKFFRGSLEGVTVTSLLSQGFILQSVCPKMNGLNVWTFTKPPLCPGCSGDIAEC